MNSRRRAHQPVGPADDAGASRQVAADGTRGCGRGACLLASGLFRNRQKSDASGNPAVTAREVFDEWPAVLDDDQLGSAAQCNFQKRRVLQLDFEQLDDVPQDGRPGRPGTLARERQNLANANSQPFLAALELVEERAACLLHAALFAQLGEVLPTFGLLRL